MWRVGRLKGGGEEKEKPQSHIIILLGEMSCV